MSYPAPEYYSRPPGSSHGPPAPEAGSPERLHSSQGYHKSAPPAQSPGHHVYPHELPAPPGSSHGYPPAPAPITPISGSAYPPQPPSAGGYYGLAQTPSDAHVPSPPPTSNGRPGTSNFTTDGQPIVPVGISGGKMFQCRGYGDCDKVFTRSEHLARHVRKHTGERPFPCHCGKAFSRLDNLRQHAATVHADQAGLNDAMLNSLAPVHAALSQRANREQRKRGEVVEVPKNAIERPRHQDTYRLKSTSSNVGSTAAQAYPSFPDHGGYDGRPRTSGGYDYPYPPVEHGQHPVSMDSGPSRRPGSAAGYPGYPQYYEPGAARPPTAPGTASSTDSMSQLPYPYRPMSSNGRELPVPAHYAESEPPSSAHGPPQSPMYPQGVAQPATWSSPPPPHAAAYPGPEQAVYPPQPEGYQYPPDHSGHTYGPPPPGSAGSSYNYPPSSAPYYPGQAQAPAQPPYGSVPPQGQYGPGYGAPGAPPPPGAASDSPFQYQPPAGDQQAQHQFQYGYDRKRRGDEGSDSARKTGRPSSAVGQQPPLNDPARQQDPLWLPPASERRSSLAISALLGSPQAAPRSRPSTADVSQQPAPAYGQPGYPYAGQDAAHTSTSLPATPVINGAQRKDREGVKGDLVEDKKHPVSTA